MGDLFFVAYPWVKALHIMAVIAWMAGLFYLPRLYVYHAERAMGGGELAEVLQVMEVKLLRLIMNPSMIVAWAAGLWLVFTPGVVVWTAVWPWTKLGGILAMTWFHMWLAGQRRVLADGGPALSGRGYRLMNEVPTLLMILIVLSVVVKF